MSKKSAIISLGITALIGCLLAALSINMFMADVLNKDIKFADSTLIASIPAVVITLESVAYFFYVIRLYQRPKTSRKLSMTYLIMLGVLSLIGLITAIIAGIVIYHGFFRPYPYPGYIIVNIVIHVLLIGSSTFGIVFCTKMPEDEEKFKVTFKHVMKTIGWFLFMLLAFNRVGMFIASPIYVQWRTLYLTFPFYLFLALPGLLCIIKVLDCLGVLPKKLNLILSIVASVLNVVLFVVIVLIAMNNTTFISAVSPAMPLERLASMPMEIIIHFVSYLIVGTILLVHAIKVNKAPKE